MEYKDIRVEICDRVMTITKQNAASGFMMTTALTLEMMEALKEARSNDDVSVIVITTDGIHQGAAAVSEAMMGGASNLQIREAIALGHELCRLIETLDKPVIGVNKTDANGGGFETLQACDFLICADTATFTQPEVTLGIIAGWGGVQRVSRMIGWRKAQKILLLGEPVDGKTAEEIGIVTESVPLEEVDGAVKTLCEKLLRIPTAGFAGVKRDMHRAMEMGLQNALDAEVETLAAMIPEGLFTAALTALTQGKMPEYPPYHRWLSAFEK